MIKQVYTKQDLPMEALRKAGLVHDGVLILDQDDLKALLSGRRTEMQRLEKLEFEGMIINSLDAKLSLQRDEAGVVELLYHPINKEPKASKYLTRTEAEMLAKGDAVNLQKTVFDDNGRKMEVLIEFDNETNEFIVTDTEKILAPDSINDIPLTPEQKERYRKGKEVEIGDGTTVQYSGTEKQGVRSNKLAFIASVLIDGGLSYVLYHALNKLFNKPRDQRKAGKMSEGYFKAWEKMEQQEQAKGFKSDVHSEAAEGEEYEGGFSR